jgi:hypothetical protein
MGATADVGRHGWRAFFGFFGVSVWQHSGGGAPMENQLLTKAVSHHAYYVVGSNFYRLV